MRGWGEGFAISNTTGRNRDGIILSQKKEVKQKLLEIDGFDPKSNFDHPVFGQLNRKQTKRFLKIHTDHDLKIIENILSD